MKSLKKFKCDISIGNTMVTFVVDNKEAMLAAGYFKQSRLIYL